MSGSAPDAVELHIDPPPGEWRAVVAPGAARAGRLPPPTHSDDVKRCRAALGLPTEGRIVMSGHQPGFWHPGILAKRIAAPTAAEAISAEYAWLIVDQDEADITALRVPTRDGASGGSKGGALRAQTLRIGPEPTPGAPACAAPSFIPGSVDTNAVHPAAKGGVRAILEALRAHAEAPDGVAQVEAASRDLLEGVALPTRTLRATELAGSDYFHTLLARMRADPARCVATYNEAAAAFPDARIAPMAHDKRRGRWELPLWRIVSGRRERVWSDEIGPDAGELAPRAILMTTIVRAALCDLFLHGRGGIVYDRVAERWAGEWLGVRLAPMVCVSATLRLPLLDAPAPTPEQAARARWLAHHARHNPGAAGDAGLAQRKRELLRSIENDKAHGRDPASNYRALHELLDRHRRDNAEALAALEQNADAAASLLRDAAVADDRTWAFPLHSAEALASLRDEIERAFSPLSG